jgi:glycine oxidase
MLALDGAPIAHCLAGNGVYVVPRGGRSVVGSTLEDVGFDATTTDEAIGRLRRAAAGLVPALAAAPEAARWAGLRPMTPDALPRLGRDPAEPRVLHAAGLSKNGILLAPLVADAVGALATGGTVPDLAPFCLAQHAG